MLKDYSLHSGERYPDIDLNLIGPDHIARYEHISNRINNFDNSNCPTLYGADIFCGSGYGSALIASRTRAHLLSIDGSTEAIQNANRLYFNPRIFFCAKHFPFHLPESQFDFIACIESLEHIKDYASFFTLLAASIKPGGLLFVSVPNEEIMPHGGYKWHIKHFYADELRQLAKNVSLEEVSCFSTRCTVIQDSKSRIFYPYQINNGEILQEAAGDTLLYEFKKI